MGNVREKKTETIVIRTTPSRKRQLKEAAESLDMPYTTLAEDRIFKGKMTDKYAKRIMVRSLVTVSSTYDKIMNEIVSSNSEYIKVDTIMPYLQEAKEVCDKLWKRA